MPSWMPLGRDRPDVEKTVGARPTPPEGDAAGTHNGLRSHGRFRCLVFLFGRAKLPGFGRYLPEDPSGCRAELTRWALTAPEKGTENRRIRGAHRRAAGANVNILG